MEGDDLRLAETCPRSHVSQVGSLGAAVQHGDLDHADRFAGVVRQVPGRLEHQSGHRGVRRHHRVVVHHQRPVGRDQFDEAGVTSGLQGALQLPDAGIDARVDRLAVLSDQGTVAGGKNARSGVHG